MHVTYVGKYLIDKSPLGCKTDAESQFFNLY